MVLFTPDTHPAEPSRESNKHPKMLVDYNGTWDIVSNVNFEGYMVALGECDMLFPSKRCLMMEKQTFRIQHLERYVSSERK